MSWAPTNDAIIGLLADGQERTAPQLCNGIGRPSGTLHPNLTYLLGTRKLVARWEEPKPRVDGRPRRRYYRLHPDMILPKAADG
ncbi:hypothetical protein [Cryptosporangium minutisporangium]|uniref:Transcriptional regulator n=1 Tax=Cryptosporangium minutisporangium TaxID=113569 RepID=A0ABP6SX35_9ACTN